MVLHRANAVSILPRAYAPAREQACAHKQSLMGIFALDRTTVRPEASRPTETRPGDIHASCTCTHLLSRCRWASLPSPRLRAGHRENFLPSCGSALEASQQTRAPDPSTPPAPPGCRNARFALEQSTPVYRAPVAATRYLPWPTGLKTVCKYCIGPSNSSPLAYLNFSWPCPLLDTCTAGHVRDGRRS